MFNHPSYKYPVEWNNSIYIPTIYKYFNKADIEYYLKDFGKISRIDFVDLNHSNSSRRVFVHFSESYDNDFMKSFERSVKEFGYYTINLIKVKKPGCFAAKIFINKKPLSNTQYQMNILKKYLFCSLERIDHLEHIVEDLKEKITSSDALSQENILLKKHLESLSERNIIIENSNFYHK